MIENRGELRMSDDLDDVRAKLAARREGCYDRIDDAVSELVEVHAEDEEQILAFVREALDRSTSSGA